MKRKILTGIFFSVLLNVIIKTAWIFGIELSVQRSVGTEAYGLYFSTINFAVLFFILLDLGITNYNTRSIAMDASRLRQQFINLAVVKFLLGTGYFIVLLVVSLAIGYDGQRLKLLVLLGAVQFVTSFTLYLRSNLSALHFFRLDGFLSVTDRALLILFCGLWLWSGVVRQPFSIYTFAWLQLASGIFTALIAFIFVLRYVRLSFPSFRLGFYTDIVRKSLPFALLFLIMSFYSRTDAVLIDLLLPDGHLQAGIYAAAFRLFDAYSQIAILFSGILLPVFSRQLKLDHDVSPVLYLCLRLLLFSSFALGLICLCYGDMIADALYREHVDETGNVLVILVWAGIPFVVSMLMGTLLTAAGKLGFLNRVAMTCLVFNLLSNILMITLLEGRGAAIVTIATHTISAILLGYGCFRHRLMHRDWKMPARIVLFALVSGTAAWLIKGMISGHTGLMVTGAMLLIFGVFFHIVPLKDIVNVMIKSRQATGGPP